MLAVTQQRRITLSTQSRKLSERLHTCKVFPHRIQQACHGMLVGTYLIVSRLTQQIAAVQPGFTPIRTPGWRHPIPVSRSWYNSSLLPPTHSLRLTFRVPARSTLGELVQQLKLKLIHHRSVRAPTLTFNLSSKCIPLARSL